ncbi:MAG: translocation/assembly module TamB domain-containing protein [Gammaproteobacteria bacterium]
MKISALVAASLALLFLVLIGSLFVAGNTDSGRALIERLTLRLTSGRVALSGLAGSFPQQMTLAHLELSDDRGLWLSADGITLRWSPLALLAGRVQVATLHVVSVDMQRLPESSTQSRGSPPASIPRIDVADLKVDVVKLGPALAGASASLVLSGNAHLRSVEDMVFDGGAHRIDGDGEYQLHLRFDPRRMDLALNLHEPAGGPLENLLGLPGLGALAATLNLNGLRSAERLELSLDAGAVRGRAQGSVNVTDLSADLDFSFDSPALSPRPDIAWERASVRGRWQGSIKAPHAHAQVEAAQLLLPGGTRVATLHADVTADAGNAALHALIDGLRIPGLKPQLLQDSPLTIDAAMRLDQTTRPLELTASHRLFILHAATLVTPAAAEPRSATLEIRLPDLTPLAALGGQNVRGSALVKAQLRNDGERTALTLSASAALGVGKEFWSVAVGNRAALQLSGALTGRAIVLESMKFTGRALSLSASGEISRPAAPRQARIAPAQNAQTLGARWDLTISDLKTLSPPLAGTLKASGALHGPTNELAGEAHIVSTLAVRDSPQGTVSASIKLRGLPAAPSGTLLAQGSFDGAPMNIDIAVERSQAGSVHALIKHAEWKSAHVSGDVTVATDSGQSHGQLAVTMAQLGDLHDLLGAEVGGSLTGTVMLHPDQGRTHVRLHLEARDLTAGRFTGNAQLAADGAFDGLGFKLDVQVPKLQGAKASLSAAGLVDLKASSVTVETAAANYHGLDLHLTSPSRIALADGVSIDILKIAAQTAVFELKGEILPVLDVQASLLEARASLINSFIPGLMESGSVEAHARLQGSLAAPTGEVRLSAKGLTAADDAAFGLPPLDVTAAVQLQGGTAQVDAHLVAGSASRLSLTGKAPLAADGALELKINGKLDIGMINPLLEARGQHAAGDLTVDATVTGSVADPQIEGSVNLTKGSVRDFARGVGLTDINAAIIGSAGTLQIQTFTATAAPGTVTVSGKVGVLQKGIPVDLLIKAVNAQPLVSKLVTANLNAELHVSGTARERLDIAGTVHLNRTLIGIPNGLPSNVAVLEVRRRGKTTPRVPDKPLVIGLDVGVQAPQEILVQGRGIDAEMYGDLHIGGTTDSPYVSGEFDLRRGNFTLAGNKLNFSTDSRVSFNGAGLKNKIDPSLDFKAEATVADATVTLTITGYADSPQFEFTSSSGLAQDEIMARLLFGVSGSQLTALQLAQVGAALATLSGVGGGGGLNPLVKLQKSLGLDRLTIGAGTSNTAAGPENSGASIQAGRYISKRVYVEAKQSTTGTSQLEADVDLTKHLKLQTRLGNGTATVIGTTPENDPGSSIGLIYQFDY